MKLTKRWLIKNDACREAVDWFAKQEQTDHKSLLEELLKDKSANLDWANWYIARRLPRIKKVRYAVYAAKQVLKVYENRHLNDERPRKAIRAAESYIKSPTIKNKTAAASAASAADYADSAAYAAAYASASAAYAAASASASASASAAASAAAYADSAASAKQKYQIKILRYGLRLLEGKP